MTAAPDTKLQVNLRAGDALINVYATDEEDLDAQLAALGERSGTIVSLQAEFRAAAVAAGILGPVQDAGSRGGGTAPSGASAPSGAGPAPECAHGTRVYVNDRTKAGVPFEAWDCPQKGRGGCPNGQDRTFISYNGKKR